MTGWASATTLRHDAISRPAEHFDAVSLPAQLVDACAGAIGPVGVLARSLVGITLLALALLWRDPDA